MALELVKLTKGSSAVSQVGSYGFFKLSADTGGGSDIVFDRVFGNNTPDVISAVSAEISANNMTSAQVAETYGWNIGDTIDITLTTNEVITMRIVGFNHDNKSGGSGKAGVTLEMVNCLATLYEVNKTATNAGGWKSSRLRNTTLPTIKGTLPTEWQNIIKLVDKKSANGGSSNFSAVVTTSDELFLLSQIELFGPDPQYSQAQNNTEEGVVYEYWNGKINNERAKKYDKNADGIPETSVDWWLRSSAKGSTIQFCNSFGPPNASSATNLRGISFAFCV